MRSNMKTKLTKETQLILDSQDRVLKGFDDMILQRQTEMQEKLERNRAAKNITVKKNTVIAQK